MSAASLPSDRDARMMRARLALDSLSIGDSRVGVDWRGSRRMDQARLFQEAFAAWPGRSLRPTRFPRRS